MGFFDYSDEVKKVEIAGEKIFFISDWNSNEFIARPIELIDQALMNTKDDIDTYYFTEDEVGQELIANCACAFKDINIIPQNILIGNNATALLSLIIFTFNRLNKKKVIFVSPAYFSVVEICKELNFMIFEYHVDFPRFIIDYEELENLILASKCDWLLLTDPFFGSGVSLSPNDYRSLCRIAEKYQIYLVIDFARGGASWYEHTNCIIPPQWEYIRCSSKGILVDSLSKRLFVNGIKVSILVGDERLITECREYSDSFFGSISALQVNLLKIFYDKSHLHQLNNYIEQNIKKAKNNYQLLKSITLGSSIVITQPTDGNYVLIGVPRLFFEKNSDWDIFTYLLHNLKIFTLPMSLYNYECKDYYLFRVNLLLAIESILDVFQDILNLEDKLDNKI